MFFFFSKLTYFFISPFNWIIVLLIWLFFSKSAVIKKRLAIAILALLLVFGNEVLYKSLVNAWQPKPVILHQTYQAGIILGGLGSFDKHRNGYLNSAADRLVETAILYHTGKIRKIIISGGALYNDRPKEAPFLKQKFTELGIPAGDIIIEDNSRTTFENAAYTKKIVDSLHLQGPFVLVTSAMHMPRSQRAFAKARLPIVPFPCDYKVIPSKPAFADYFIPKLHVLEAWDLFAKEVVGLAGYTIFNKA